MKIVRRAAVAALLMACANSYAAYTAYIYQDGPDVRVAGSGSFDMAGLTTVLFSAFSPQIQPNAGRIVVGSGNANYYSGPIGPASFGPGGFTVGSSGTGSGTAIGTSGGVTYIHLPLGYVSGSVISGGAVFNGATLASLGATVGTYVWTWGAGANADSFTLQIALAAPPTVSATKAVSGPFTVGSTATYTVVLSNTGPGAQPDNPGNEYSDVLPAGVTLVSATATSGTAVATVGTNTVTWNGSIPSAGSVTLTITTTVAAGAVGTTVSSQGVASFDADANGTNDTTVQTDDPGVTGTANPTVFTIAALPGTTASIPTLSEWMLIALSSAVAMAGLAGLRRKS